MESWRFRKGMFFLLILFSCVFHYSLILGKPAEHMRFTGIIVISASLAFYTHSMFPRTHEKREDFRKILKDDPYRYVRHPFYSTFIIMELEIALFCLSVSGLGCMLTLGRGIPGVYENTGQILS
ncbi:isoprenylcysteine carboxylmethyltransferase family protein [Thermococcus sp.]